MRSSGLPGTVKDAVLKVYAGATMSISGGACAFTLESSAARIRAGAPPREVTQSSMLSLMKDLDSVRTPLAVAATVMDEEIVYYGGLNAWFDASVQQTYTPKDDADRDFDGWWLIQRLADGRMQASVFVHLDRSQVAQLFEPRITNFEPYTGMLVGFDLGGGDHPLYLGLTRNLAGAISLTAGVGLGGGQDAEFGFGMTLDGSDLIDRLTGGGTTAEPAG